MHKIKAIISDSDGTLVNTLYLIRHGQYEAAVEYMIERGIARHDIPGYEALEVPTYDEYEAVINQSVGGSTRETFERTLRRMLGKYHAKQLEAIDFDELDRRLGPIQDRLAPLYVHPFHNLTAFLNWVGERQLGLGIFTSGSRHHIIRNWGSALPGLGYATLFSDTRVSEDEKMMALIERAKATYGLPKLSIVTCDDVTATKPDPEGVLRALDELGIKPEEAVVLGDLDVDIVVGQKAGVAAIGVSYGFGEAADLEAAGAVAVAKNLAEVMTMVDAHNSGKKVLF